MLFAYENLKISTVISDILTMNQHQIQKQFSWITKIAIKNISTF